MRELRLPPRLRSSRSELTEIQETFLDCYLLGIGSPKLIFQMLCAIGKSQSVSNSMMTSLINCSDGKEYLAKRREQLEKHFFVNGGVQEGEGGDGEMSLENSQKFIVEKVMADLAAGVRDGSVNIRSSQIIEAFLKKSLDFDAAAVAAEPPRIYLPENCLNCRYRVACESDDVVDDCQWCKYRKSCNERGEVYDQKTQLEIPDEELKK